MKEKEFNEFALMDYVYAVMRETGRPPNLIRISFGSGVLEDLHKDFPNLTHEELLNSVGICHANEWLKVASFGGGPESINYQPTTTGVGVAKSRFMMGENNEPQTSEFRTWCNNNQGLLAVIGLIVAVVGIVAGIIFV